MSFPHRTHRHQMFLVVFAVGIAPFAAAMQEATTMPSAPHAPLQSTNRRYECSD